MILKNGQEWHPTARMLNIWREMNPNLDIDQELAKMAAWLEENPTRRKTERGMNSFVGNWLRRARPVYKAKNSTRDQSLEEMLTDRSWAQ